MKNFFLIIFVLLQISLAGQNRQIPQDQSMEIFNRNYAGKLPVLRMDAADRAVALPPAVDNSLNMYFPGVLDQGYNMTCQQVSGVSYCFAYEMSRTRNLKGNLPENMYPEKYSFNFMNKGSDTIGVSFFYSWDVIRQQGHPVSRDYPDDSLGIRGWLSGYERYHEGMKNRIKAVWSIPVDTEEGLQTLKHYLYDHLDGSQVGGLAVFGAAPPYNLSVRFIPPGLPFGGEPVVTDFYPLATHGMTLVGYNDSVRYDINGDGLFTNDIDLNGDGKITPADYENGAYRLVNSGGTTWYDSGFIWVMYRALALNYDYNNDPGSFTPDYGAWNGSVYVLEVIPDYEPLMTMKVRVKHNNRELIALRAGISQDTSLSLPTQIMTFPIWNFQGGSYPLNIAQSDKEWIEAGFDITPLLSYVTPGNPFRVFLICDENDETGSGSGIIGQASFFFYDDEIHEYPAKEDDTEIVNNGSALLSATFMTTFSKVSITGDELPTYEPSMPYNVQLHATGGKPPYTWTLLHPVRTMNTDSVFPVITSNPSVPQSITNPYKVVPLPFGFPFCGKLYDTLYMNAFGFVCFTPDGIPDYYVVDPDRLIRTNKIIAPLLSLNYNIHHPQMKMWYEHGEGRTTLRWLGIMKGGSSDVNFAMHLYDDGRYEFLYGDCSAEGYGNTCYTGMSAGDYRDFEIRPVWDLSEISGKSFLYEQVVYPGEMALTPEGMLSVSAFPQDQISDVFVSATDAGTVTSRRELMLGSQLVMDATATPVAPGPAVPVRLRVKNISSSAITGLQAVLRSENPGVNVPDSTEEIGDINAGETIDLSGAFSMAAVSGFEDGYPLKFTLNAGNGSTSWSREVFINVSAPRIVLNEVVVEDGVDGYADPGEIAPLRITLDNPGSAGKEDYQLILQSQDSRVIIFDSAIEKRVSLPSHGRDQSRFMIAVSPEVRIGDTVTLRLFVNDGENSLATFDFRLVAGRIRVAVINLSGDPGKTAALGSAAAAAGVSTIMYDEFPRDLNRFSASFISLGQAEVLSPDEKNRLTEYLGLHNNLYLEGYAFWKLSYNKDFVRMLHDSVRNPVTPYSMALLTGAEGTFAESMAIPNSGPPLTTNFKLIPVDSAFILMKGPAGQGIQTAYAGTDFRRISSLAIFENLRDTAGGSDRNNLMKEYLDFFGVRIRGPKVFFHCDRNEIPAGQEVRFSDDSFDSITGRQWIFSGGTPSSSAEKEPIVRYDQPGIYDVKLTAVNPSGPCSLIKEGYIRVTAPNGIAPHSVNKEEITFYPNPATTTLTIHKRGMDKVRLIIRDLRGQIVIERLLGEPVTTLGTGHLKPGMYLMDAGTWRGRLVVAPH